MPLMRFLPLGLDAMLVELDDLDQTLALLASLRRDPFPGIAEIVPGARTLLIRLSAQAEAGREALAGELCSRGLAELPETSDARITIPVLYDGEDLEEVAALTGMTQEEVIARHTASVYTVAFTGFAPGFAYLTGGDPKLLVPRRRSPRARIPAGSVALAGEFSGIYPKASPGGWQIIGRTPLQMFDLARSHSALLQPGAQVRFTALADRSAYERLAPRPSANSQPARPIEPGSTVFSVTAAPLAALWQDLGRYGHAGQGIASSGARDRAALRLANEIVGNGPGEACLEIYGHGFAFTTSGPAVVALAGAPATLAIRPAAGTGFNAAAGQAVALEAGDAVTIEASATGVCSYLAVRGGFEVAPVLGSASFDSLAQLGPDPVRAGAEIVVRHRRGGRAVLAEPVPLPDLPASGDLVELDIVMGPRTSWFTETAIAQLTGREWTVTPQSDRVGLRLAGATPLKRVDPQAELPSEGTIRGAVQVPHSGQPIVFLADHPLTVGYPVIATIAPYHLDLAGQVPAGARIRFRALVQYAEITPQPEAGMS